MKHRQTLVLASAGLLVLTGGGVAAAATRSGNAAQVPHATCTPGRAVSGKTSVSFDVHCAVSVPRTTITVPGRRSTVTRTMTATPTDARRPSHKHTHTRRPSPKPTHTRPSSPTPTGTPSTSPSPTSTRPPSPTPTATTNPTGCTGKPTATNTGASGSLRAYTGKSDITTAGAVIQNVVVSGGLTVNAPNVTLKNVRINGGGLLVKKGGDGTTVDHVSSNDGIAISSAQNVTVEWSTVVAADSDALHVTSDDSRHVTGAKVRYNYLPAPSKSLIGSGAHFDGLQVRGSDNMLIQCNNWQPGPFSAFGPPSNNIFNGDVFLEDANGGNHNVTVDSNWMYDSGISLRVQAITRAKITNNHFGGNPAYGFCNIGSGAQITAASGNVNDNNGKAISIPAGC